MFKDSLATLLAGDYKISGSLLLDRYQVTQFMDTPFFIQSSFPLAFSGKAFYDYTANRLTITRLYENIVSE